jgi:guanylate kinase
VEPETQRGNVFVVSAPSGAGKHTILRRVLARDPRLSYSVSMTTRPRRDGEVEGRDYYFVDRAAFEKRRDVGELFEWAEVHGNLYGTLKSEIERLTAVGNDVVLELDVQGMRNVKRAGMDAVTVFIMAPAIEELGKRLRARGTDSSEAIAIRLRNAEAEIAARHEYDYVIVNKELDTAVAKFEAIVRSRRRRDGQRPQESGPK